jgi:dTDP-4-amino-4,6-dideoxygalactose transaminase
MRHVKSKNRSRTRVQVSQLQLAKEPDTKFLVFGRPDIGEAEIEAVTKVLRSGWVGSGPVSKTFEDEFADHLGASNAVAVSSCTMGLMLALRVSGIGQGKEVIVPPMTFAATVNAILAVGATPVFSEVTENGLLDPDHIFEKVTERTAAIIPVHYTGAPADMNRIMDIAGRLNLTVIEDAAHAFGGTYEEQPLGTLGHFGVFSFYATKNITAGEGGMVCTGRGDLAQKIRLLSRQGLTEGAWGRYSDSPITNFEVAVDGYKGNLPDVLAAIGLSQLRRWDELKEKRQRVWTIYEEAFGKKEEGHSQHLYTLRSSKRDHLRNALYQDSIGTGVHYRPLHVEQAYRHLRYREGDFPIAEKIGAQTVSLPVSSTMTEEDAFRVVNAVKKHKGEGETK